MLAATCLVFFPLLASGSLFGQPLRGSVSPAGIPVIAGRVHLRRRHAAWVAAARRARSIRQAAAARAWSWSLLLFIVGSVIGTAHAPVVERAAVVGARSRSSRCTARSGRWPSALAPLRRSPMARSILERRRHGRLVDSTAASRSAMAARTLAARRRRHRTGRGQHRNARHCRDGRGASRRRLRCGARRPRRPSALPVHTWPYWTAPAQKAALEASVLERRDLGDELRHHHRARCWRRCLPGALPRRGGSRRARWSPPSSAGCCSATARASPSAATSAPISAASRPAACTDGCGCPRRSPVARSAP